MKIDDALRKSFELGMVITDKIKQTALEIREEILQSFRKQIDREKWPPLPDSIPESDTVVPTALQNLIQILKWGGREEKRQSHETYIFHQSRHMYSCH